MPQDYSTEWRAALIERDMAVRAIVEFLEALDKKGDDLVLARNEVKYDEEHPDALVPIPPGEEPSTLAMLRRVKDQLGKKLNP